MVIFIFPHFYRTIYPDFVHRFIIIKPKEVHAAMPDLKESTKIILSSIEAMNDKWRLGHTKVFFRAGAVGCVEESREECIKAILNYIQGLNKSASTSVTKNSSSFLTTICRFG